MNQCLSYFSLLPLFAVSLSFLLPGSYRSQPVCSLNRLDLSTDSETASVFNSAHASPFTLECGLLGWVMLIADTPLVATHANMFLCLVNAVFTFYFRINCSVFAADHLL